jgi:hypothetical protein
MINVVLTLCRVTYAKVVGVAVGTITRDRLHTLHTCSGFPFSVDDPLLALSRLSLLALYQSSAQASLRWLTGDIRVVTTSSKLPPLHVGSPVLPATMPCCALLCVPVRACACLCVTVRCVTVRDIPGPQNVQQM